MPNPSGRRKRRTDPFFEASRRKQAQRKDLQVCAQVARCLWESLPMAGDPLLQRVQVLEVVPAQGLAVLEVRIWSPEPLVQTLQALRKSSSWLREEVAQAIHRKRVPTLRFVWWHPEM